MIADQARILVVAVDEVQRRGWYRQLEQSGFQIVSTSCGREALELAGDRAFDLVLLDLRSATRETLSELRRRYTHAELPIIVSTPPGGPGDIVDALNAGANDYLTNDVDSRIASARIRTNVMLKRATEELAAARADLSRLQRKLRCDLQAAADIQQNQMPADDLEIDGWDLAWHYHPCDTLAGDSLNIIRLDEDNWAMYVLDVSGHGVPASLLAVSVNRILTPARDGSGRHDTLLPPRPLGDVRGDQESPAVASAVYVLERLQEKFVPEAQTIQYFTILYATLNARTGEMRVASGGHPSPILWRAGEAPQVFTNPDGPAIGLIPVEADIHFHEAKLQLHRGDTFLMYSDGVVEAFNADKELFGAAQLRACLRDSGTAPLQGAVQCIDARLADWRAGAPQKDDETLLAIRRIE